MSLAGDRAAIAAALSTVAGVKGYESRPTTPRPGDAWPLLSSLDRDAGQMFMVTWLVRVFLPQDERGSSDWIDTHHEALVDGLLDVGFVDRIEPVATTQDQYVLQITMRGE